MSQKQGKGKGKREREREEGKWKRESEGKREKVRMNLKEGKAEKKRVGGKAKGFPPGPPFYLWLKNLEPVFFCSRRC